MPTITNQRAKSIRATKILLFAAVLLTCVFAGQYIVYADGVSSQTKSAVDKFTTFILAIAVPIAAVGLASLGICFFQGEKKAEEAMHRAKLCLVAVCCLGCLTIVIRFGQTLVDRIQWDPALGSSHEAIIDEQTARWTVTNTGQNADGGTSGAEDSSEGGE